MYSELAPIVFSEHPKVHKDVKKNNLEIALDFANNFDKLGHELSVPLRLRDVGIAQTDIADLATDAMKQTRLLPNNIRPVSHVDALELYKQAY